MAVVAVPTTVHTGYRRWLRVAGALLGCVLSGFALAHEPWLITGAVGGSVLLMATLTHPLVVIGLMLSLGPIDLSFATGGFKSLFPALGGLDMNGIRLIGVVFSLSAIALVDRSVVRHAAERYGRWYLLFLLFAGATLVFSLSPIDGMRLLLKLLYPFLTFAVVLGVVRTRHDLERLADWILIGAAVITLVLNPFYVLAGGYEVDIEGRIRVYGLGAHENPFSFYLLVVLLLSFSRYLTRGQVRYLALCAVCGIWMVLTLTRITFLATMAGLFGFAAYGALVERNFRPLIGATLLGAALAIPLAPRVLERTFGYIPTIEELLYFARHPVQLFGAMNWQGREIFWAHILQAFRSSPIIGLGLGSSTALLIAAFPPEWGLVVHNEYLRLAVETGLVGVALYAIAVGRWWSGMIRVGRDSIPLVREFALPAMAAILAWAVIAATDNAFDYYAPFTQYVGFLCAGAFAAHRIVAEEQGGQVEVVR